MLGSYIVSLLFATGLAAQTAPELKNPGDVLKVQPFRQWMPKKARPHAFLVTPRITRAVEMPVAATGACSIPLLTIKPEPTDEAMVVPVPKTQGNMPQVTVPAPPCENWPMK